jgi:Fe-Mn family superoxide dismutase
VDEAEWRRQQAARPAREEDQRRPRRLREVQDGVGQFGSGWAWLQVKGGKLEIAKTPNGENPLVHGAVPILGVDVWEHSYYIDYRNRRPDYLKAFVDSLVNWDYVDELFGKAG